MASTIALDSVGLGQPGQPGQVIDKAWLPYLAAQKLLEGAGGGRAPPMPTMASVAEEPIGQQPEPPFGQQPRQQPGQPFGQQDLGKGG